MKIKQRAMGMYQTNCYIVSIDGKDLIIDPGVGAVEWIKDSVKNPVAILNTHGHFDHIWSNAELQKLYKIKLYTPEGDAKMLQATDWMRDLPVSYPDVEVKPDETLEIDGIEVKFLHFPGHCPGCSVIEIGDVMFSGDFIFKGSIGRVDFPYSSPSEMRKSLKKFAKIDYDKVVYPGHGDQTTIKAEQKSVPYWLRAVHE